MEAITDACVKCGVKGELFRIDNLNSKHEAKYFCREHYLERGHTLPESWAVETAPGSEPEPAPISNPTYEHEGPGPSELWEAIKADEVVVVPAPAFEPEPELAFEPEPEPATDPFFEFPVPDPEPEPKLPKKFKNKD